MKTIKSCPKNSNCQLWHMLCDGNPCLVDREIDSDSDSLITQRSDRMWHLSRFKSGNIIDLAVRIEKMGSQFYKKLAKKASNEQIKNLLLYLASQEQQYQNKLKLLGKEPGPVSVPKGKYAEYVGSTVDTHMFSDADKIDQLVENIRFGADIIRLATEFEKDTILFLNGVRNLVHKDKQEVIDNLIKEKQINLVKLTRLRKEVMVQDGRQVIEHKRSLKTYQQMRSCL